MYNTDISNNSSDVAQQSLLLKTSLHTITNLLTEAKEVVEQAFEVNQHQGHSV